MKKENSFAQRWFMNGLAIAFPWLILLVNDNPAGALLALVMQASILGWIPASMWALRVLHDEEGSSSKS